MKKILKIMLSIYIVLTFVFGVFGMVLDVLDTLCILFISPQTYNIILTFYGYFTYLVYYFYLLNSFQRN